MRRSLLAFLTLGVVCAFAPLAGAKVLRVGSYHGVPGQYKSIQAAVNAARPGDWILIGPGDYKTKPSSISTWRATSSWPWPPTARSCCPASSRMLTPTRSPRR